MVMPLALAAAIALQTAPGVAPTKAAPPPAKKVAQASGDKVICEMMDVTGSMFQRKVCLTQAGWDQMRSGSQDFMSHNSGAGTQVPASTH